MPMTRSEAAVMDLWDQGLPKCAIARRTGLNPPQIASIVSAMSDGGEQRRTQAAIRAGSAQLLAAMLEARAV